MSVDIFECRQPGGPTNKYCEHCENTSRRIRESGIARFACWTQTSHRQTRLNEWQGNKDSNLGMLESKSSALTSLAIPLRNLLLAVCFTHVSLRILASNLRQAEFYSTTQPLCKRDFNGCCFSERAFHPCHLPVISTSTWSASASLAKAQNTHAPEPVIRASP